MALYRDLAVMRDVYRLILRIFEYTADFSLEHKYTLGQDLKRDSIVLVRSIQPESRRRSRFPRAPATHPAGRDPGGVAAKVLLTASRARRSIASTSATAPALPSGSLRSPHLGFCAPPGRPPTGCTPTQVRNRRCR